MRQTSIGIRKLYAKKGEDRNSPEHLMERLIHGIVKVNGCWEWQRHLNNMGYGKLRVDGKMVYAHRLMYSLHYKADITDMLVCHKCDNPKCINPEHLFMGTQSDNMRDCAKKGRANTPINRMPGESNPASKLTQSDVDCVRDCLRTGMTQQSIANLFGVTQTCIGEIKRGITWKTK